MDSFSDYITLSPIDKTMQADQYLEIVSKEFLEVDSSIKYNYIQSDNPKARSFVQFKDNTLKIKPS